MPYAQRNDRFVQPPELAGQVVRWRRYRRMTQAQLERRAGLAHNALSRIEREEVSPRLETVERIAAALDLSVEELQFRTPPDEVRELGPDEGVEALVGKLNRLEDRQRRHVVDAFHKILDEIGGPS